MLLDQLLEGDRHGFFDRARLVDVTGDREKLGAGIVRTAEARIPGRTATQDGRGNGDRLDVVDRGRATIETHVGRERRLQARLALLAFKAFEKCCFFAADVSACAVMDDDVDVVAKLVVLAEQTVVIALVDRSLQGFALAHEFAADIDEGMMRAHGEGGDDAAFDQGVRIMAHDLAVLAGAGLRLVCVDDEVMRTTIRFLRHEGPLETGREACAAATAKAGGLHLVDDPVTALFEDLLGAVPVAARHGALQGLVLEAVNIGEDAILISQHNLTSQRGFLPKTLMYSASPPLASALACLTQSSRSMRPENLR